VCDKSGQDHAGIEPLAMACGFQRLVDQVIVAPQQAVSISTENSSAPTPEINIKLL